MQCYSSIICCPAIRVTILHSPAVCLRSPRDSGRSTTPYVVPNLGHTKKSVPLFAFARLPKGFLCTGHIVKVSTRLKVLDCKICSRSSQKHIALYGFVGECLGFRLCAKFCSILPRFSYSVPNTLCQTFGHFAAPLSSGSPRKTPDDV